MSDDNELLTINQILELSEGKACRSTVWRWIRVGVKRKKLSAVLIGGKWFVRQGDFFDFLGSLQPAPDAPPALDAHAAVAATDTVHEVAQ